MTGLVLMPWCSGDKVGDVELEKALESCDSGRRA